VTKNSLRTKTKKGDDAYLTQQNHIKLKPHYIKAKWIEIIYRFGFGN
jgi:hypothetical protein